MNSKKYYDITVKLLNSGQSRGTIKIIYLLLEKMNKNKNSSFTEFKKNSIKDILGKLSYYYRYLILTVDAVYIKLGIHEMCIFVIIYIVRLGVLMYIGTYNHTKINVFI